MSFSSCPKTKGSGLRPPGTVRAQPWYGKQKKRGQEANSQGLQETGEVGKNYATFHDILHWKKAGAGIMQWELGLKVKWWGKFGHPVPHPLLDGEVVKSSFYQN